MKITIEGVEYEFVPLANPNGSFQYAGLKPVKKTGKNALRFELYNVNSGFRLIDIEIKATEPTALKLSEAISAMVEYLTKEDKPGYPKDEEHFELMRKIDAAYAFYQESQ